MTMGQRLMWLFSLSTALGCTPSSSRDAGGASDASGAWDVSLPPGVTAAPDGVGFCCLPDMPSCDCHFLGAHADTPAACEAQRRALSICDLHPNDWLPVTDTHGCAYYGTPPPLAQTTSCFPNPSAGDAGVDAR